MVETAIATTREDATLPARYEAAKRELAECERVDECATWAKKAAALASYARQADDKSLEEMAVRIRARAIRRCGELLKEIPAKAGRRLESGGDAPPHLRQHSERARAAEAAGLSADQTKDALRIAKVSAAEFEDALESENPPTIEALAERGTKKKPAPPPSAESCSAEAGVCGPVTTDDKVFHISAFVENLYAVKDYELDPLIQSGTKSSLRKLSKKVKEIVMWLEALDESINRRIR